MRGSRVGGQNMPRTHPPPGKLKQPSDPPPREKFSGSAHVHGSGLFGDLETYLWWWHDLVPEVSSLADVPSKGRSAFHPPNDKKPHCIVHVHRSRNAKRTLQMHTIQTIYVMISRFPLFKENFKNQNDQNVIKNMYKDRYIIILTWKTSLYLLIRSFKSYVKFWSIIKGKCPLKKNPRSFIWKSIIVISIKF